MKKSLCSLTFLQQAFKVTLLVALASVVMTAAVQAAPIAIIDQQNTGPGTGVFTNFSTIGDGVTQGFTPTQNGIDALEIDVRTTGTASTIQIDIFAGDGDGGALLGSSGILNVTNTSFATKHFDFAATVSLTPNTLHSFRLTHLGGDAAAYMEVTGDNYPGGIPRNPDGTAYPDFDLVFTEGLHVPEPGSLSLAVLGLSLFAMRRKR